MIIASEMNGGKNDMTKNEMKKLIKELAWYIGMLRKDVNEGYIKDALDDVSDIQGISAQLEEALRQRLGE